MTTESAVSESKGNVITLALAWLAVGIPLLWGVVQTVKKAMALFA